MGAPSYRTMSSGAEATGECVDRKSRFIAQLVHAESEREADAFVAAVRSRHHDARHNVPAWILSDGRERCSDDGEPSRTAGMPVLEQLRGAGLADVCCVVARYFGGVLLGPGGLVRAYEAAAKEAIRSAEEDGSIVVMTLVTPVTAQIPYSAYEQVKRMVENTGGKIRDSVFAEDVQLSLAFRAGEESAFLEAMREFAAGEELCGVGETTFSEL